MAYRAALPAQRGRHLLEGLARTAGACVERSSAARAAGPRERRVARGADGSVRTAAPRARNRHAARRTRLPRDDVQPGDHRRAAGRHRYRTPRTPRLDRSMAVELTAQTRE